MLKAFHLMSGEELVIIIIIIEIMYCCYQWATWILYLKQRCFCEVKPPSGKAHFGFHLALTSKADQGFFRLKWI